MKSLKERVFETPMMKNLTEGLSAEEIEYLERYTSEVLGPIEELASYIQDQASTEKTDEELSDAINDFFSPEGIKELNKCLGKN